MEEVEGKDVVIRFDGKRCIHARHCVLQRPEVFVPNVQGAWIHPDAARAEEVAAVAQQCPSGAITYVRKDGAPDERPPVVNLVRVREHGPYALWGELTVDGEPMLRATLCRCGASKRKPFCDGSHQASGFHATGEPATRESQPLAARAGPLEVTPRPDGPLVVKGNLEIVSGTGRTIDRVTKATLCRCGHSGTKPFCDGTHARVGFKSTP
ncbi:MAG: CDGSH iron-sulfur domain-containing protein [Deltaproteobacteria bacterium]|nr:CDGSH iron-sulfur domain-containing protein [Deltaproteobacteria bacterium]